MRSNLTTLSKFPEKLKLSMQKNMNSQFKKYKVPLDKFTSSIKNGQIIKIDDKFWIKGFENKIEVVCDLFSDTPTQRNLGYQF